jgi:hypothetical protein
VASGDVLALFSAGAAASAAVLSGLTLYLSGRREHLKWARSALEEAFVKFLTASYAHRVACRDLARLQEAGRAGDSGRSAQPSNSEDALRATAAQAHRVMMECVTRFRVLAGDTIAEAALALHEFNDQDMELVNQSGGAAELLAKGHVPGDPFSLQRDVLIRKAQEVLGISPR